MIGQADCFEFGERLPLEVLPVLAGGWDTRCPPLRRRLIDQTDCHFQQWSLTVIDALYAGNATDVLAALAVRFPTGTFRVRLPGDTVAPGVAIVRLPGQAIVVVSGTTNGLQVIAQVLAGLIGPTQFPDYQTLPVWMVGASAIADELLDAAVGADDALTFVGHSLGGATAAICAARAIGFKPTRDVGLVTFGAPKPGDVGLSFALKLVLQSHYIAQGDPIPFLPPSGLEAVALQLLVSPLALQACRDFLPFGGRLLLNNDGSIQSEFDGSSIALFLYREVFRLLNDGYEWSLPYAHSPSNYRRLIVCPTEAIPPIAFRYLAWGGGGGGGSARFPATGGAGNGSAVLVQLAQGGGAGDGQAPPMVGSALLFHDTFVDVGAIDLSVHTAFAVDTIGASWSPSARMECAANVAHVKFATNGLEICTVNPLVNDVTVVAEVRLVSVFISLAATQSVGVTVRADSAGGGWIATVTEPIASAGFVLRLYDASGYTGYDQSVNVGYPAPITIVSLSAIGPLVTATAGGISLSYASDTLHSANTLVGIVLLDNPSPLTTAGSDVSDFKVYG